MVLYQFLPLHIVKTLEHKINPSYEAMAINPVDVHTSASNNIKLLLSHTSKISLTFLPFLPFILLSSLQLPSAISTILALPNHKPSEQRYFDNQQTSSTTSSFLRQKSKSKMLYSFDVIPYM